QTDDFCVADFPLSWRVKSSNSWLSGLSDNGRNNLRGVQPREKLFQGRRDIDTVEDGDRINLVCTQGILRIGKIGALEGVLSAAEILDKVQEACLTRIAFAQW